MDRVGGGIEFGKCSKVIYQKPKAFFGDLNEFISSLPRGPRYSVELGNHDYLDAAYFDVLKTNGVAARSILGSTMTIVSKQILIDDAFHCSVCYSEGGLLPQDGRE